MPRQRSGPCNREFVVECDASGSDIRAVKHQGSRLVPFFSRPLTPCHSKLATYECKLIRLVQAVHHWCPYLSRFAFLIHIDHFCLKYLLDQRLSMIPQHQWDSKLMGFNFRVEYQPGSANIVADTLSRCDTINDSEVAALSAPTFNIFDSLRAQIATSPELQQLKIEVADGGRSDS
jgi:hypothetical protein